MTELANRTVAAAQRLYGNATANTVRAHSWRAES